jgi:hypothetical protein
MGDERMQERGVGMAQSTRERLMATMMRNWEALLASFDGLTEDELVRSGVVEEWSVKDILAHITTWEEEALHHLPGVAEGRKPPTYASQYGGLNAFNALKFEENRRRSLDEVLTRLHETHARLLEYLNTVPDELLSSKERFRSRLKWDTYTHYAMHAKHIREWRSGGDLAA